MKILQTIGSFDIKSGGPTTCTYDLLSAIHKYPSTQQFDILTPDIKNDVNNPTNKLVGDGEDWIKVVKNDYLTPLCISKNLNDFLKQSDYDLYHSNGLWMHINHITCSTARSHKKPYIITPHGMLYSTALSRSRWKKNILRKIWFDNDIINASCLHATCNKEMEEIRKFGYKGPIAVIGNPVNIPPFTQELIEKRLSNTDKQTSHYRIGFLGRLHPIKCVENIITALHLIKNPEIELLIFGSGDNEYEILLKSLIIKYNLEKQVIFKGFVTGEGKYQELASLDALFVPSAMENFGMIIPEALIVGTPVMASLGTPWQALNDEKCGWWVDNSPESISKIIINLTQIPLHERIAMGKRGRDYILRTFAAENVAKNMIDLYSWILEKSSKPDFVYTD